MSNNTEGDLQNVVTLSEVERKLKLKLGRVPIGGIDSDGNDFKNLKSLWKFFGKKNATSSAITADSSINNQEWYKKAFDYWESAKNCPVTDDGVLGGFGHLTPLDSRDSLRFLDELKGLRPEFQFDCVADCGSGIGRVAKSVLFQRFHHVALVEQSPRLLQAAPKYLQSTTSHGKDVIISLQPITGLDERVSYINVGLQDFNPLPNSFDCIWIQWVIGHLSDIDYVKFIRRCAAAIKPGGAIILKDNVSDTSTFMIDCDDSSVARCLEYHKTLFEMSEVDIVLERRQTDFPTELCSVYMIALVPR